MEALETNVGFRLSSFFYDIKLCQSSSALEAVKCCFVQLLKIFIFIFSGFIFTGQYPYCPSGKVRHGVCIYGVEDLPFLAKSNAIMANKVLINFILIRF